MSNRLFLCHLQELPEQGARGFDPLGKGVDTLFVVRKGDALYAYRDQCPHYQGSTSLPWRKDAYLDREGEIIVCAVHGAIFDISTGVCLRGPCVGQSLTKIPVQVSPEGQLLIDYTNYEE